MSASSSPTLAPSRLSATARLLATVLLPTPPLPLITSTTLFTSGTGSSARTSRGGRSNDTGARVGLDADLVDFGRLHPQIELPRPDGSFAIALKQGAGGRTMLTGKFEGSLAVCALALGANACGAESLDSEVLESTA